MSDLNFTPLYSGGSLFLTNHEIPVVLDIDGMEPPDEGACVDFRHNPDEPVADNLTCEVVENGGKKQINATANWLTGARGRFAWVVRVMRASGQPWEGSILATPKSVEDIPAGEIITVNGRSFVGPVRVFRTWKFVNAPVVYMGADPSNELEAAASGLFMSLVEKGNGKMGEDLRSFLIAVGLDPSTITPEQATIAARCLNYITEQAAAEGSITPTDEKEDGEPAPCEGEACEPEKEEPAACDGEATETTEEEEPAAADGDGDEDPAFVEYLGKIGIDPEVCTDEMKAALLKAFEASKTAAASGLFHRKNPAMALKKAKTFRNTRPSEGEIAAAALYAQYGGDLRRRCKDGKAAASGQFNRKDNEKRVFSEAACNEACSAKWTHFDLRELFENAFERVTGMSARRNRETCARWIMKQQQVAAASGDFSVTQPMTILGDFLQVRVIDAYENYNSVADILGSVEYQDWLQDAKLTEIDILGNAEETPEGGEIASVELRDRTYNMHIIANAFKIVLTEEMYLKDQLNALAKIPFLIGNKIGESKDQVFFKELTSKLSTLCNPTIGNAIDNVFGVEGLDAASVALAEQKRIGSTASQPSFTGARGKYVLIAPALLASARALFTATNNSVNAFEMGNKETYTGIPFAGEFTPVTSPYWGARGYGVSNTHWALFADPDITPAVFVNYIRGGEKPTIEQFPTDPKFGNAKTWRVIQRFGVSASKPEGIAYSTGTN